MYITRLIVAIFVIVYLSAIVPTVTSAPEQTRSYIYRSGIRSPIRLPLFYDDSSMLRFVSRTTPLSDRNYVPSDLVSISGSLINEAGRHSILRRDARDALWNMARDFVREYQTPLTVISGYRSAAYQQRLWDLGRCSDSLCAPPGYSEHQLGLAVDLFDASNEKEFKSNPNYRKYVKWLEDNAHTYGWTQSYQKGVEIDEYQIEPWHYRYVGVTLATRLHTLGWTYTEFVRFQEAIAQR